MQTIVLDRPGALRLADTPAPAAPGPGEALLRIHRVGICGTDLHAFEGTQPFFSYPRVLGHELGAEVLALGPGEAPIAVGDRCTVEPYLSCGRCGACRRGKTNCCEQLRVLGVHVDGGMRELICVPTAKLHRSAALSFEQLALVEPLCIGAHAVRRAQPAAGEPALVIGAGPIGLAVMLAARLAGARVIALELSAPRLEFAQRHLGAEPLPGTGDVPARLRELLGGDLPTLVFDATGSARSMMAAPQYLANGGTLVFVGLVQGALSFDDPELHRREVTLLRSRNATAADFGWVMGQIEAGRVSLEPGITHRAAPAALVAEFDGWRDPAAGVVKAMLELA